eukprot:4514041-Prymnesium_polylepis.1
MEPQESVQRKSLRDTDCSYVAYSGSAAFASRHSSDITPMDLWPDPQNAATQDVGRAVRPGRAP